MNKFQNKYRIPSARLQSWDYASAGMYFITICTKDRLHFFGEIENREMDLSEIGSIALSEWIKTPQIRSDMNIELGEFVVMPNHFHAIIIIGKNVYNTKNNGGATNGIATADGRDAMHCVSTHCVSTHCVSTHCVSRVQQNTIHNPNSTNQFGPQSKNLASIIRGFKSSITTYARKNNIIFDWQPLFHDHIIRSIADYERVSNYILHNPRKWENDLFNKSKKP